VQSIGLHGRKAIKPILDAELVSLKELGIKELSLRSLPGSDHMSFNQVGVPGFLFEQNMDEYFLSHHSQSDTLDKAREADLIQGAQAMAITGLRVANLATLLPRETQ
jgi:carboxypeptidase Q